MGCCFAVSSSGFFGGGTDSEVIDSEDVDQARDSIRSRGTVFKSYLLISGFFVGRFFDGF